MCDTVDVEVGKAGEVLVVDISKVGKQKNENNSVIKWTTLSMHVFCTGAGWGEGGGVSCLDTL